MKNRKHNFLAAIVEKIMGFISPQYNVANTGDDVIALKQELRILENELHSIEIEKMDIEKLLADFQHRHSQELGEILLEILRLRKFLYQSDKVKFEEAEMDEKKYREQVKSDKKKQKFQLTYAEKKDLKKKFRRATFLCHPDKVNEKNKAEAQRMFISLKAAYDSNDLHKVDEILNHLEKGDFFKSNSETVSEKELLNEEISKLRKRIQSLEKQVSSLKGSHAYKTVIEIDDRDAYFKEMKIKLEAELEEMKQQVKV